LGRRVDLTVLSAICLGISTMTLGHVGIDKVTHEDHEMGLERGQKSSQMLEAWKLERVLQRVVWESGLEAG
jgi:hypothetical protein